MLSKLLKALAGICPPDHRPLLIGFSGGPDSLSLVHGLHTLGISLLAAHVDHALRSGSELESQRLDAFCRDLGVPFISARLDAAAYARENRASIEEAARIVRYRFLFATAQAENAWGVAVGHTADDQVETVLMHFLRGAGISGLKGMAYRSLPNPWSATIPLLRPLLAVWRSEVEAYCTQNSLQAIHDPSNIDRVFTRNRIRHELIPYLEEHYNPALRSAIWKTAESLQADQAALAAQTDRAWQSILLTQDPEKLVFSLPGFNDLPLSSRRAIVRRAAQAILPDTRDLGYDNVEKIIQWALDSSIESENVPLRQTDLIGGLRVYIARSLPVAQIGFLRLSTQARQAAVLPFLPTEDYFQVPEGNELILPLPGMISLPGWQIQAEWVEIRPQDVEKIETADTLQAWLGFPDPACLPEALSMRPRRSGDRIQPLGMPGKSAKVSDLMINSKIPRQARSRYPLFCLGEEILWIPALCLAHPYRVSKESRAFLHLMLKRGH